jgi:hypothetical protein
MLKAIDQMAFDSTKPFRALVLCYLAQLHGFIDLASRGFATIAANFSEIDVEGWASGESNEKVRTFIRAAQKGHSTPLIGNQAPYSRVLGKTIEVSISGLAEDLLADHNQPLNHFNSMAAGSLLVLAWDLTEPSHTHHPTWEFLRHCRNAASHHGRFNLLHGEPRRPAEWRGIVITPSLQGVPLFSAPAKDSFLGPGDPLLLLHDIESTVL